MATAPSIGRARPPQPPLPLEAGDATRELYERYGKQIYRFCLRELRNREEAEDATQTTFMHAFRGLDRGVALEYEAAWLYTIASRVCVSRLRSASRRRRLEAVDDLDAIQELVPSASPDVDELFGLKEALEALPEQQRRAVLLREWQGLSCKEIAAELGLTTTAVEMLLFRARRGLVERLRERLRTSGDMGALVAAAKAIFFGGGAKVAATLATVAATSVVAATPVARHELEQIVAPAPHHTAPATKPAAAVPAPPAPVRAAAPRAATPHAAQPARSARPARAKHAAHTAVTHAPSVRVAARAPATPAAAAPVAVRSVAPVPVPVPAPPSAAAVPAAAPTEQQPSAPTTTAPAQKPSAPALATPPPGPPALGDLSPASGPPGTMVTVAGTNLRGTSSVTFNGTAAQFTVNSESQLRAKVPAGATTGPVGVTTPAGTATSAGGFTVTAAAAPTAAPAPPSVSGISPASGSVGTVVTIGGAHFTGATGVHFNGVAASFVVVSDTQISTHVPDGATSGPVAVGTPAGVASGGGFTVVAPAPTVGGLSPSSGPVGTIVTVGGSHLTGATAVTFNGVAAKFTIVSDSQLTAQAPDGATSGPIAVTTPGGTATSAGSFALPSPPSISGFSPTGGPAGTIVTISGAHFTGVTSVTFNGVAAKFTVGSESQINAQVPAGAATGPIAVTTAAGTATSGAYTVP